MRGVPVCSRPADVRIPLGRIYPWPDERSNNAAAGPESSQSILDPEPPLSGCMLHPDDDQAKEWLSFMMQRPGKDVLLFLRKWLREALRKEGVQNKASIQNRYPGGSIQTLLLALALCSAHAWQY